MCTEAWVRAYLATTTSGAKEAPDRPLDNVLYPSTVGRFMIQVLGLRGCAGRRLSPAPGTSFQAYTCPQQTPPGCSLGALLPTVLG